MKKYFLILSLIVIVMGINAQSLLPIKSKASLDFPDTKSDFYSDGVKSSNAKGSPAYVDFLNEGFESGSIPASWTIVDGNVDGYKFHAVAYPSGTNLDPSTPNGGLYYAQYSDDAAGDGSPATIEELITPVINTNLKIISFYLSYDYNMEDYTGYGYFESQIRTFDGVSWSGWSVLVNHTVDQISSDTLDIFSYLPAESIQVRILFNDENYWGWGMGIDNIQVYGQIRDTNDLTISGVVTPAVLVDPMIPFYPEISVMNVGLIDQYSFDLECFIYDKESGTLEYSDTLAVSDTLMIDSTNNYAFNKSFSPKYLHNYRMTAIVNLPSDTMNYNDTLEYEFWTQDLNVSLSSFVVPPAMSFDGDYGMSVTANNIATQTADFNVYLLVVKDSTDTIMSEQQRITGLAGGDSKTIAFNSFMAPHDAGLYTFTVYSDLHGDYDHSDDTIIANATVSFPWSNVGDVISDRFLQTSCVYDDGYFVIGGLYNAGYGIVGDVMFYSPDSGWSLVTTLPTPICGSIAAVIDGKLYVLGGGLNSGFNTTNAVQIYDLSSGIWSTGTSMPTSLFGFGGGYSNGKMYVIGGSTNSSFPTYCYQYVYTPAADTAGGSPWDTIAQCPRGTTGLLMGTPPTANEVDSLIMVGGDYRGTNSIYGYYIYNINQNSWTTIDNPPTNVGGHGPGLIYSNSIFYLIGGCIGSGGWGGGTNLTYKYDSNWRNAYYTLIHANHSFASAALSNASMYAAGGYPSTGIHEYLSSNFDVYAPYISFTDPVHKAVSVPYDQTIVIGFSERIDTSMGFDFSINPDPGLLLGIWNSQQDTFYFLHDDFDINTTYYVTVNDIYDTMGFPMKSENIPNPFGFSTGLTGVNGLVKNSLKTKLSEMNVNIVSNFARFDYAIGTSEKVEMNIYSVNGALVRTLIKGSVEPGTHKVIWNLKDNGGRVLPSGTYMYKFTAGKYTSSGKLTIIK